MTEGTVQEFVDEVNRTIDIILENEEVVREKLEDAHGEVPDEFIENVNFLVEELGDNTVSEMEEALEVPGSEDMIRGMTKMFKSIRETLEEEMESEV